MRTLYKGFCVMHNRSNTPDILGSIMSGSPHKEIKPKELVPPPKELLQELKEKATFNLPVKLLSELEDKYYEIRKLCKSKQISKTLIVEEALNLAFAEFEKQRQESKLFVKLSSNKAVKQ